MQKRAGFLIFPCFIIAAILPAACRCNHELAYRPIGMKILQSGYRGEKCGLLTGAEVLNRMLTK